MNTLPFSSRRKIASALSAKPGIRRPEVFARKQPMSLTVAGANGEVAEREGARLSDPNSSKQNA
jgi:hypothetical protein